MRLTCICTMISGIWYPVDQPAGRNATGGVARNVAGSLTRNVAGGVACNIVGSMARNAAGSVTRNAVGNVTRNAARSVTRHAASRSWMNIFLNEPDPCSFEKVDLRAKVRRLTYFL